MKTHMKPIVITMKRIPGPAWVYALTLWPFIFMEPRAAADPCVMAHEMVHWRAQRQWLVIPWLLAYLLLLVVYAGKPASQHPMEKIPYAVQRKCEEASRERREVT